MAGDWLKIEHSTPDKPEVHAIAETLGIAPETVVGHLLRLWIWADQQTIDGNALNVTKVTLDNIAKCAGLGDAMLSTGWLTGNDRHLTIPNFDRHNGKTAKKRALTAKRQAEFRAKKSNALSVTSASPREEKSIYTPPTPPAGGTVDKSTEKKLNGNHGPQHADRELTQAEKQIAACKHPERLSKLCRHHGYGDPPPGMGFEAAKTWAMRKAIKQAQEACNAE